MLIDNSSMNIQNINSLKNVFKIFAFFTNNSYRHSILIFLIRIKSEMRPWSSIYDGLLWDTLCSIPLSVSIVRRQGNAFGIAKVFAHCNKRNVSALS